MSTPTPVGQSGRTRLDQYHRDLQAYRLAQCTWLGMDPEQVFRLDDALDPRSMDPAAAPPDMTVTWKAIEMQQPTRGHPGSWGVSTGDELDRAVYLGEVFLDWQEQRHMEAAIGPKPEWKPWSLTDDEREQIRYYRDQPDDFLYDVIEGRVQQRVDAALAPIEALVAAWEQEGRLRGDVAVMRAAIRDARGERHATITQVHTEAPDVV